MMTRAGEFHIAPGQKALKDTIRLVIKKKADLGPIFRLWRKGGELRKITLGANAQLRRAIGGGHPRWIRSDYLEQLRGPQLPLSNECGSFAINRRSGGNATILSPVTVKYILRAAAPKTLSGAGARGATIRGYEAIVMGTTIRQRLTDSSDYLEWLRMQSKKYRISGLLPRNSSKMGGTPSLQFRARLSTKVRGQDQSRVASLWEGLDGADAQGRLGTLRTIAQQVGRGLQNADRFGIRAAAMSVSGFCCCPESQSGRPAFYIAALKNLVRFVIQLPLDAAGEGIFQGLSQQKQFRGEVGGAIIARERE